MFNELKFFFEVLSPRRRAQLFLLQILSLFAAAGEIVSVAALLPFLRLLADPKKGLKVLGILQEPLLSIPEQYLVLGLGLCFILSVLISSTIRVLTVYSQLTLAALIGAEIGEKVFKAVLHKPFIWHLQNNTSKVIGYISKDVDQVFASVQALLVINVNLLIISFLGIALIVIAPSLMIIIGMLLLAFYLLVFKFTRGRLKSDGEKLTNNYQASLQIIQEGLGGIRDLILDRHHLFFSKQYTKFNRAYRLSVASINISAQAPRFMIEGFSIVLIIGISLYFTMSGQGIENQLPLLGVVVLGCYRLLQPIQICFNALSNIQANRASFKRIQPLFDQTIVDPSTKKQHQLKVYNSPLISPFISLQDVCFRYNAEEPWVIKNFNLDIHEGERLAIVGSTGSGKSTTTDLILGLLKPVKGRILINGQDLHMQEEAISHWYSNVAHVPQSIYLSDSSFVSNIAFGVDSNLIDFEKVVMAARLANIDKLIEDSLFGYQTVVGERGVSLSGGQRQRIGIARAFYKDARLLVLDEATSALDNATELSVMNGIKSLQEKYTVIMIAHRLSTLDMCDRVVYIENGIINGIGTYDELYANNSGFYNIASKGLSAP